MYISIIRITCLPLPGSALEHQRYHGVMVSSALVESDVNMTHSKINVDDPVITLMEAVAFRMPFVLRLLGNNNEHCVVCSQTQPRLSG